MGHYPVFSGGDHGNTAELISDIKPLFERYQVDVYLCGHDHGLQHLNAGGVDYVVSGGGSRKGKVGLGAYQQTQFASEDNGFAIVKMGSDRASVTLVGAYGQTLYHFEREKRRDPALLREGLAQGGGKRQQPRLKACIKACESVRSPQQDQRSCVGAKCWTMCQQQCLKTWNSLSDS